MRHRDRDIGRGRGRFLAGSGMDSIPRLGSCPELKADAQPLNHPGVPVFICLQAGLVN